MHGHAGRLEEARIPRRGDIQQMAPCKANCVCLDWSIKMYPRLTWDRSTHTTDKQGNEHIMLHFYVSDAGYATERELTHQRPRDLAIGAL